MPTVINVDRASPKIFCQLINRQASHAGPYGVIHVHNYLFDEPHEAASRIPTIGLSRWPSSAGEHLLYWGPVPHLGLCTDTQTIGTPRDVEPLVHIENTVWTKQSNLSSYPYCNQYAVTYSNPGPFIHLHSQLNISPSHIHTYFHNHSSTGVTIPFTSASCFLITIPVHDFWQC